MNILETLKGKRMNVMTDMKVAVQLTIESVKEEHHSQQIGESTPENDWWPETNYWTTIEVKFTNGAKKSYGSISELDIIND